MSMKMWHSYHMVTLSPWPILVSIQMFSIMVNASFYLNSSFSIKFVAMKIILMVAALMWWKDTLRENTMEGSHNFMVIKGLKMGMIMFILSEVFFFISFFWSFFHFFLSPNVEIGQVWPPVFVSPMTPVGTPLLNTLILISSGVSITCAHNYLMGNNSKKTNLYLSMTWILGAYFMYLQYMEYSTASFSMSDSSYGSIFFMGTGFHGMHVLIGSFYLLYTNSILWLKWPSKDNLVSIDLSAWYWHFVDVVWIYLYLFMYWLPFV